MATVLVILFSARMLDMTDGLTTTSRPESESHQSQPSESGDFLSMSDVGTGHETNSRNFRVSRSAFADFCTNGDCVQGDVLKVVSKLAKRILSDPRVLGLRTATETSDEDTKTPDESVARAAGSTSFDTRPFSGSDYYYDAVRNRVDRHGVADSVASSSSNYRQHFSEADSASYSDSEQESKTGSVSANDRDGGYGYGGGDSYSGGDSYGDSYGGYGGGSSYGGSSYGGGYGGYESCCNNNKLLPILLVGLLGLLAFFLYLRSTTTAAGRRSGDENDISDGKFLRDNQRNYKHSILRVPINLPCYFDGSNR